MKLILRTALPVVLIIAAMFVFVNTAIAETRYTPVHTFAISAGIKSFVPLGLYRPTDKRWGAYSLDYEWGAQFPKGFRLSTRTRGSCIYLMDMNNLFILDQSIIASYNIAEVFEDRYLYISGGVGLGYINRGIKELHKDFPTGTAMIGIGIRSVQRPSMFFELTLWHASSIPKVDGGINSFALRSGFEFGRCKRKMREPTKL